MRLKKRFHQHIEHWKRRANALRRELHALYLASRDPRVPWYARTLAMVVVAYALSPIDLIPDSIPVLGYLDDLLLIPLGIFLVLRWIPEEILNDCREKAGQKTLSENATGNRIAVLVIVAIWMALFAALAFYGIRFFQDK